MENNNLIKFRVQNFRSVDDSGWINADNITCLVGVNEAGKTNLLLPLWKLKPANDEAIIPLIDYPRKKFADYKLTEGQEIFISADFNLTDEFSKKIAELTFWNNDFLKTVRVHRKFDATYEIEFPNSKLEYYNSECVFPLFDDLKTKIENLNTETHTETIKIASNSITSIEKIFKENKIDNEKFIKSIEILSQITEIESLEQETKQLTEKLIENFEIISDNFDYEILEVTDTEIIKQITDYIPNFIYFSDYGKLNAEIHLPTVVANIQQLPQQTLSEKLREKARTLKVLFDFVNLEPSEILQLGQENPQNRTEQIIEQETKKKKERGILLHSASSSLTNKFKEWWKQGEYNFRFEADGNYFRIWVNDDKREEWIELENRSRGLQWFFSFLLVFLVESRDGHSGSILLLDEPGITLHPIAQSNLINYFKSLSEENQLVYTTHSPFLVDAENLGQVKAVFVDDKGFTAVSEDLRRGVKNTENSVYPVNAAIGLTVSDTFLLGSQPVIVEGTSDQIYLQIIKNFLIGKKKINPTKELVFIPTGGVRGMSSVINLVVGRDEKLPSVILDADKQGKAKYNTLKQELYADNQNKLILLKDIIGKDYVEIEDLFPEELISTEFSRLYKGIDDDFDDIERNDKPIIQQIENFAKENDIELEKGYKVTLAKRIQKKSKNIHRKLNEEDINLWTKLFERIIENNQATKKSNKKK